MGNVEPTVLVWVFFASQGVTDNIDLMRAGIFTNDLRRIENATLEMIKNTSSYASAKYDLPAHLMTDEKVIEMYEFSI